MLLSGGLAILCDGGALRDSRSPGPMYVDAYPMLCGCMCVRRVGVAAECARLRLITAPGIASTKRFLFLVMPKRRDCVKSVSRISRVM